MPITPIKQRYAVSGVPGSPLFRLDLITTTNIPYGYREVSTEEAKSLAQQHLEEMRKAQSVYAQAQARGQRYVGLNPSPEEIRKWETRVGQIGLEKDEELVAEYKAPWGETLTNVPLSQIQAIEAEQEKVKRGELVLAERRGTAGVPLYVPKGTVIPTVSPPTQTSQRKAEIQRIQEEIAKVQKQLGILQEAKAKGMEITPKTTIEEAQKFLTEFRPPTTQEVGELPAQKSSDKLFSQSGGLASLLGQELVRMRTELETTRKERETWLEKAKGIIETAFSREKAIREMEKEANIKQMLVQREATLTEITSLRDQIVKKQTERDEALALSQTRLAPMAFIRGEQARIDERYQREIANLNAQLGNKIALYQAQAGEIEEARRWINDIVEAATWDEQFRWQQLTTMMNIYDKEISELGADYRNLFSNLITLARLDYEDKREELKEKYRLITDAAEKGVNLNIDPLNTSLDEAIQIYAQKMAVSATTTTPGAFTDILQEVIDKGGTPEQAAREVALISEQTFGIPVNQKQLNEWVEQARKLKPKTPPPEIPAIPPPVISEQAFETGRQLQPLLQAPVKRFEKVATLGGLIPDIMVATRDFFKGLFSK